MAADLVNAATSEKIKETDWMKNIEICELVTRDNRQAKSVVKSIKRCMNNKNPNNQLLAVTLLEMLMNNCGECIHRQVVDVGLLPILVKIVKKKNDLPVRERIFLLLDAMQTSLGGASGRFPQYYAAYYDLVSAQVEFPRQHRSPSSITKAVNAEKEVHLPKDASKDCDRSAYRPSTETKNPDFSAINKAASVLEVLRVVLDTIGPQNPEGASDEFTLDLVEQCSFQKQRLMHLIMTCRDEKVVSQAIELNEKLHGILVEHDALLSVNPTSIVSTINHVEIEDEEEEEEDADCLLHRLHKGKACATDQSEKTCDSIRSYQDENLRLPLARPLCTEPDPNGTYRKPPAFSQLHHTPKHAIAMSPPSVSLPPPPSKHLERERFFKEKQRVERPDLLGLVRGLSLHSQDGSSSCGSSSDSYDRDPFNLRDQH